MIEKMQIPFGADGCSSAGYSVRLKPYCRDLIAYCCSSRTLLQQSRSHSARRSGVKFVTTLVPCVVLIKSKEYVNTEAFNTP